MVDPSSIAPRFHCGPSMTKDDHGGPGWRWFCWKEEPATPGAISNLYAGDCLGCDFAAAGAMKRLVRLLWLFALRICRCAAASSCCYISAKQHDSAHSPIRHPLLTLSALIGALSCLIVADLRESGGKDL